MRRTLAVLCLALAGCGYDGAAAPQTPKGSTSVRYDRYCIAGVTYLTFYVNGSPRGASVMLDLNGRPMPCGQS